MKRIKIYVVCLCLALFSLVFAGCVKEKSTQEQFVEVASVWCDGVKYQSEFEMLVGDFEEINSEEGRKLESYIPKGDIRRDKSNLPKVKVGDYVYSYESGRKARVLDFKVYYVKVNSINDNRIRIKYYDEKLGTYLIDEITAQKITINYFSEFS